MIHWKPDAGTEAFCCRLSPFISAKGVTPPSIAGPPGRQVFYSSDAGISCGRKADGFAFTHLDQTSPEAVWLPGGWGRGGGGQVWGGGDVTLE